MDKPRVFSTKRLLPQQRQRLVMAGLQVVDRPFIKTQSVSFKFPKREASWIFTSQNAVKAVFEQQNSAHQRASNIYCVGEKTKQLLERFGQKVTKNTNNSSDLASFLIKNVKNHSFLFFCGNKKMDTLGQELTTAGMAIEEVVVYETILHPHKLQQSFDALLFFSPSGVESFLQKNSIGASKCFCIGSSTAAPLMKHTQNIQLASQPTVEHVLASTIQYFKPIIHAQK